METPQQTLATITAVALAISEGKSKKELIYIAEIFSQLSHTLKSVAFLEMDLDSTPKKP